MSVVLDAGALIALERGDILIGSRIHSTRQSGIPLKTHGGVIAQVWRGGRDQARLARALRMVETVPLDEELGRQAGVLLARSGLSDAIDAASVDMPVTHNHAVGISVGFTRAPSPSPRTNGQFPFTGTLSRVVIDVADDRELPDQLLIID